MANIKNFGLSGVSGDVQFGKAGGRVVYDAGSSVFKVTQSNGSTLDNIRVATPVDGADAATKSYVDTKAAADSGAVQSELDATQVGAGLSALGAYVAPTTSNYHNAATSLASADFLIDAAIKAGLDAAATDRGAIRGEFAAADTGLASDLTAKIGDATVDGSAGNTIDDRIATSLASAQSYADQAESDAINTAGLYTDGEITDLDTALRLYVDTVAAGKDALAELVDVALASTANGDLLMYNSTTSKWENVNVSTSQIDEGTNLYYTDGRARGAISVSGDLAYDSATGVVSFVERTDAEVRGLVSAAGDLAYNSATGVFSFTERTDAEVRGLVSAGGDLAYNSATGQFSVTKFTAAEAIAAVEGEATLDLAGSLTVAGATTLNQLTTVISAATLANANAEVNVFHVTDSAGAELFEVRQNGDAVIGGTLTVNGSGATISGGITAGDITATNADFTGNVSINGNLTVDGASTFVGTISGNDMTLAGNLIIGDADTDFVTFNADVNSNIIPDVNLTYDLGSATKKWNNIYVGTVNATTLIGSLTGQVSDISNHETYIEGLFSVVDNGGDGSLSYANGVITYTGPSATEVRAHFSAGTGVDITNGVVSIGQAVGTSDNVTFNDVTVSGSLFSNDITASEVTINGNLTVTGTTTTVNTETIELADNIIVFNSNATGAATESAGIEIERGDDVNKSLLWDEVNDRWTVGGETFVAATFIGNLTGNVTGEVSSIANHTTNALAEGNLNLYYTDARVAAYLTTNAYATEAYTDAKVADKDSFALRAALGTSGSVGTIVNVGGKTYYVSRIVVDVTAAYDADVSISDGVATLMSAANIEEGVVGTYIAEMDFSTATVGGATISLVSAATAGAATVTVEYVQL